MSLEPPEPFVVSGATLAEVDEVAELIRAAELAQDGQVETAADDVREDWARSDLARDVVLVREARRLVAYGHVVPLPRGALADGYVHPEATGRGLGRYVVRTLQTRGRELAAGPKLETGVSIHDAAGQQLLEEEGFTGVRRWLRMLVDLVEPPVVPELSGVAIRPVRQGEERAFHETFERAFARHWGHVPETFEEWWPVVERRADGDLTYFFVAERDGRLVGETSGRPRRFGMGWVGTLGVVPETRGRGIGRALLLRSMAEFWANGERRVGLAVDAGNETGATRLYESVGMQIAFGAITYEKDIGPGTVSA